MHWSESIFLSSLNSQTLPLWALAYMVPLSSIEAWLAFDTAPFSAFSSGCCVLSYTPFIEDLEVFSLILVATFRYFYCLFSLNTTTTQLLWSTCFQTTIPLYWAIYQAFANSSLFNDDFRFWSLSLSPPLLMPLCLVTLAFTKIIHVNTLISEFLNILTSNIIFLSYISAKTLSWSYALEDFLPHHYITSKNLDFQRSDILLTNHLLSF